MCLLLYIYCRDSIRDDPKMILGSYIERAQTISFVERGFEGLGLGHWSVDNHDVHTKVSHVLFVESFSSKRSGLEGSSSWPFFPASFFGASTFTLYSPSWLILTLHLSVRQVPT